MNMECDDKLKWIVHKDDDLAWRMVHYCSRWNVIGTGWIMKKFRIDFIIPGNSVLKTLGIFLEGMSSLALLVPGNRSCEYMIYRSHTLNK